MSKKNSTAREASGRGTKILVKSERALALTLSGKTGRESERLRCPQCGSVDLYIDEIEIIQSKATRIGQDPQSNETTSVEIVFRCASNHFTNVAIFDSFYGSDDMPCVRGYVSEMVGLVEKDIE